MFSLSTKRDEFAAAGTQQHETYVGNPPFPHIVIDEFIDPQTLDAVLTEVDAVDRSARYAKFVDRKTDHNKFAFMPEVVGPNTVALVNFLNSGPFIAYLEKLTGIDGLLADPSFFGGGVHWIETGGFLEIHADFNHLKRYNLERRINLLLYLNKDWDDAFNGHLELWDKETMTCAKSVAPLFDRCVIFSTTQESLHGHPVPLAVPPGRARRSIALYYYTNTWNADEQSHTTIYHISRNNPVRVRPSRVIRGLLLDLVPPIFRKSFRAIKRAIKGEKLAELWD